MADLTAYENYFQIADSNQDGKISESEAVAFFKGSNLPDPVLAQIWMYAHQMKKGFLDRTEFYNALRLVTIAQSGRKLTSDIVKAALFGPAASKIPPPNIKTNIATNSVTWPKFGQVDVDKYIVIFQEVDKDNDRKITGQMAKTLFLSWKIPKEVLRKIWYLSDQDRDGNLSVKEFCIALYLMERYRDGFSLPDSLPDTVLHDETLLKSTSLVDSESSLDQEVDDATLLALAIKLSLESGRNENFSGFIGSNDASTPSAPPIEFLSSPSVHSFTSQMEETKQEGNNNQNLNLGTCSICIEDSVEGACIPCGHMAGCMACLQKINESGGECPFCRSKIERVVKLYSV